MSAESQHKRYKAVGALLAGATLWSLGGLLVKQIDWNPVAIAGMRSAIAALIIMPFVRRARITWSPAQLGGAVAYAGTVTLFVVANKLTTAANTILLQYTAPIYVALFSAWFLREKASPLDWITTVVVLGGISLFFLDELTVQGSWGNVCAILAGVCFGWMFLFLRKQKTESPLESVFLGNVLAAVVCCPLMFRSMPDGRSWMTLVLLGTVQLGLPYILVVWAIRRVKAIETVLIAAIEPILNPIWVLLVIGERPGPWAVVGGAIVLVSVTVRSAVAASQKEPILG